MHVNIIIIVSFVVLSLLTACGGGGGDDADINREEDTSDNRDVLNTGLTGYFIFEWDHRGYLLNAATGKFNEIPNTRWRLLDDVLPDPWASIFNVYPMHNNHTEFLVEAYKCDSFSGTNFTCLFIQDYQGNINGEIVIRDIASVPLLSPDGKYISYFRQPYGGPDELEIRDRNGELISETQLDTNNIAWLPDNRLLHVDNRRFIFNYKNSALAEYNLSLPDSIYPNGFIGEIAISPRGDRMVFGMCAEYCSMYIMDIDGAGIRQLADVEPNVELGLSNPQWSPDGKWIYLKRGASAAATVDYGAKARMYAVPSDDHGKAFILTPDNSLRSTEVIEIMRYADFDNTGSITNNVLAATRMSWIP
ncbi:MAG: hypothetical protein ABW170_15130 [Candidatus Thiodiazotropha sp. L084R]